MPRLNKVIELLEQGKVVFGGAIVSPGNSESAMAFADLGYDFIIFEMEHEGFDFPNLRLSLQFLLNRRRIATTGSVQPDVVPFVRVPPNARELNQWVIKQTLDTGVYGLILPHLDTVEQARAALPAAIRRPAESRITNLPASGDGHPWERHATGASARESTPSWQICGPWIPAARCSSCRWSKELTECATCPVFCGKLRVSARSGQAPAIWRWN